MGRAYGLGMELHPDHGMCPVPQGMNLGAVVDRRCRHFERRREILVPDDKGVVAHHLDRGRDAREQSRPIVLHR